jgi:hypothetical protein
VNAASGSEPLLNESGLVITRTHLTAPGHNVELSKIAFVRIERVRPHPLNAVLFKRQPTFRLLVSVGADAGPIAVFETQDAALIERIQTAMNKAAAAHPKARRTR